MYRNGIAIGVTTVSTGRAGYDTPSGIFTILQKDVHHWSTTYDAPMPYSERLTWGGVALHAGGVPGFPESHGCVHLPLAFAKDLYAITEDGTVVVIANGTSAPQEVVHPGFIAPVDPGTGAPMTLPASTPAATFTWDPGRSPSGPLSVLVSGADRTVYVYRDGIEIGRAGITIQDPTEPLGTGVFTRLEGDSTDPNPFVPGQRAGRWLAVGTAGHRMLASPADVSNRISVPPAFASDVLAAMMPGSTLVITDKPMTGETTTTNPSFVVMADHDAPEEPKKE